jgi:hypothetical protein
MCGWCPYDNLCIDKSSTATCSVTASLLSNKTECPAVTEIVPKEGNLGGGTSVKVLGKNFRVGNSLTVCRDSYGVFMGIFSVVLGVFLYLQILFRVQC